MSPTMNSSVHTSTYVSSPTDTIDRHDYAVQKNRKPASTGGGRAWSEDEEVYLLQTRLQKMPYKHIASHLKKTELACRLHYHQLSHGSNRRKRTSSTSSGSSTSAHSPMMHSAASPVHETAIIANNYPFSPEQAHIHLPPTASLLPRSASSSPQRSLASQPIAILPKPLAPRQVSTGNTPLRLDCALPPMNTMAGARSHSPVSYHSTSNIDQSRLSALYDAHRAAFWGNIACEYGPSASASQLEDTYFRMRGASPSASNTMFAPPTPCISPDGHSSSYTREKEVVKENNGKTSISALLGIDASPRSPRERELIRQMEEGRVGA